MTDFPYEYVGGGWFRERGKPRGAKASMIHGDEAIEKAFEFVDEELLDWAEATAKFLSHLNGKRNKSGAAPLLLEARRLGLFKKEPWAEEKDQ